MTIRNIVPRNNNEGQLGTENKKWNKIYTNEIFATNFTGNLTGTADNAIKDNKSQQIDATYIKNISINNDTLTVTKGNDDSQDITINNISHAISSDNAINANKLQELTAGNSKGQIPINNGIENVNLNAALLNGKASSYFATSNHTHTTATQSSNGYMSNADKKKLDGIASGAEVNQNAFANVKVGSTTIQSDAKQDTLELVAGTNISLVGDANNDKVTIGVTGKVASASQADSAAEAGNINKGFQVNEENFHSSDFRQTILGRANSGICARPFCGKLPNNTAVSSPGMAFGGIDTHGFIQLEYGTPSAYVGGGNANKINWYKKLAFTDSNVASATKATQDGNGNTIATHYLSRNQTTKNDMNTCTTEGIYRFSGTLSNAWTGTSWGTLLVFNNNYNGGSGTGGTYLVQMAFPTDGKIYMRQRVNTGAWTGWVTLARTSDNVASATKATQDSDGNAINTTYLKRSGGTMGGALNLANGTLNLAGDDCYFGDQNIAGGFCLKGANGATNLTFIDKDNAAQKASLSYTGGDLISNATIRGNIIGTATNANNLVISGGTPAHIKYGGGDVDENTAISQNKVNLLIGSWYSTGFRDLCSSGTPIRVAINHRTGNIKTTGNITANGAMYSATPATTDNSTRVATTAYVKNNISEYVKNNISETLKKVYPVGSIYMSTVSTNPATLFGFGTWEAMPAGRVLLAQGKSSWGTTYNAGSSGGEATHKLTVGEVPSHTHNATSNSSGGHTHNYHKPLSGSLMELCGGSDSNRTHERFSTVATSNSGTHTHTVSISNTGDSNAHNNMPPYYSCYMWRRTV